MAGVWLAIVDTWKWAKLILLITSPLLVPLLLFVYIKVVRRWPIKAIILERRGDNLILTNDRMKRDIGKDDGLFKYRLKKEPDTMLVINYDWLVHTIDKATNIFEKISQIFSANVGTVFLYKYGSKQYKPINLKSNIEDLKFEVIDWDNMNFLVQEQRSIIERWKDKSAWMQKYLIPIIIIAAATLVFIFSTYFGTEMWTKGQVTCMSQQQPPIKDSTNPNIPIAGDIFGPPAS